MTKPHRRHATLSIAMLIGVTLVACVESKTGRHAYGMDAGVPATPFLHMPLRASGTLPALLSETGAFEDTRTLRLNETLLPYDIAVAFWSDGAHKSRAVALGAG